MAKYIDADKFHGRLLYMRYVDKIEELGVFEALDNEPAADVEPVKHGKWALINDFTDILLRCSCCRMDFVDSEGAAESSNYCPNCGAKMDIE